MDFDNLNDFGSLAAPTWGGSSSSGSGDAFPMDYADVPSLSHAPLRRSGMSANNNNNFGGFADPFNNSDPNDWSRAMLDITAIPLPMPERPLGTGMMPEKFSLDFDLLASSLSMPMPVSDTAYIGGGFNSSSSNNNGNFNFNNGGAGNNNNNVPLVFPGLGRVRTDSRRPFASASPVCMTMAAGTASSNNGNNNGINSSNNNNNSCNGLAGVATATVDPFDYVNDIPEELLRFDLPSELTDNLQSFSIQQQEADDADEPVSPIRVKVEGKRTKTATRRTHTRRQPTRDDFSTDAEFEEELQLWKRNREINNESVKRSRERLNQELACKKTELKTRQTQNADIVREIEVLRSEQVLLNRFSQSPMAIQEKEKSELRRILLLHLQGMEDPVDAKQDDEEDVD